MTHGTNPDANPGTDPGATHRTSTHLRLYRALTRLAPRAHRTRFRDEQCTLFADLLAQGVPARTLWRHALPDLVRVWVAAPRTSLTSFATQLAAGAARAGAATAAALEPATGGVLPTRAVEVERARELLLALLAVRGGRRGQALLDAVAEQEPGIGRDAVWRALVDLQEARLVRDDPLWGYGQVDYRMRTHYHLTTAGGAAAAVLHGDAGAPPDGAEGTPSGGVTTTHRGAPTGPATQPDGTTVTHDTPS